MPDEHGYPTDEELDKIKYWPHKDFKSLMEYVFRLWKYKEYLKYPERGNTYNLHTGGWSGNESLIYALQENIMFWAICWWSSRRGGHYVFKVKKYKEA